MGGGSFHKPPSAKAVPKETFIGPPLGEGLGGGSAQFHAFFGAPAVAKATAGYLTPLLTSPKGEAKNC